jgi:hypothetical protein
VVFSPFPPLYFYYKDIEMDLTNDLMNFDLGMFTGNIKIIVISILSISAGIITWLRGLRKRKIVKIKYDGIEKLAIDIQKLKFEKLVEQLRTVREVASNICSKLKKSYCEKLKIEVNSSKYRDLDYTFIQPMEDYSTGLFEKIVYNNNIANRDNEAWDKYKNEKIEYILNEITEFGQKIWKDDIMEMTYKKAFEKCRQVSLDIYYPMAIDLLNHIRKIAMNYTDDINKKFQIIDDLKHNKKLE